MVSSGPGFFDSLTVVELADRRNQYIGKLLSDGGARVIQVEPLEGSPGRWCGPFVDDVTDPDRCLDYWWYNTGKESVCIDTGRPEGQELLRRLVESSDIFLESTVPGTTSGWRLAYEDVAPAGETGLIYASVTDFGQDGPWSGYLANDAAHLALGGQMASSGYSDPTVTPIGGQGHQSWHIAGVLGLQALIVALIERLDSGRGQYIDCSIHDCCSICTELAIPSWVFGGEILYRQTGQHAMTRRMPDSTIRAADGSYVNTIATQLTDHLWANIIEWLKEEGVAGELDDPQYLDPMYRAQRFREGSEIREAFAQLVGKLPAQEAMQRAQSFGLTWSVVYAPEENYDVAHWNDRAYFVPIEHEGLNAAVRYPRGPFGPGSGFAPAPRGPAPTRGQHSADILAEFAGIDEAALRELQKSELVR